MKFLGLLLIVFLSCNSVLAQSEQQFLLTNKGPTSDPLLSENWLRRFDSLMVSGSERKQARIDNLTSLLSVSTKREKVGLLIKLAEEYSYGTTRAQYLKLAIELSNSIEYYEGAANSHYLLSMQNAYAIHGTNEAKRKKAIEGSIVAFNLWEQSSDDKRIAPAALLARLYKRSDKKESDRYKSLAIALAQTCKDSTAISRYEYHRAHWENGQERMNALHKAANFATHHSDSLIVLNKLRIARPDSLNCALYMLRSGLLWNDSAAICNSVIPMVAVSDMGADTVRQYIPFVKRVLAVSSKLDTSHYILDRYFLLTALSSLYLDVNEDVKSMEILPEALRIARRKKKRNGELFVQQKYLSIHEGMRDYESALEYAVLLSSLIDSTNYRHLAVSKNDLGRLFMKMERYEEAQVYLEEALGLLENDPSEGLIVVVKNYLGWVYFKTGAKEKGVNILNEGLIACKEFNVDSVYAINIYLTVGKIYNEIGEHAKAITFLEKTIDYGDETKFKYLASSYEALGDTQKGLEYFKKYKALSDSINNLSKAKQIGFLESKAELDAQNIANQLLQKNQDTLEQEKLAEERKNFFLLILSLTLLAILVMAFWIFFQRIRQERKLLEKSKEVDKLKSRFFSNISHELRTPLTLISGPIRDVINNNTAKLNQPLELALENCQKLQDFVDEILDLSKLDAAKMELNPVPCQFVPFLQRLTDGFRSHALSMNISLQLTHTLDEGKWFLIDKSKFERVTNNLLSNAIKYTPSGGEVQVIVTHDHMSERLQISVKDNGRGIHPKDLDYIFKRYYQARHGNSRLEGGTGIGLNFSHEIAKLFGGKLTVESSLGEGSIFTLYMPALESKPEIEHSQPIKVSQEQVEEPVVSIDEDFHQEPLSQGGDKKILIVEDNTDMRNYIGSILSPYFEVLTARNGKKALEFIEQEKIDLIVSDVMMPEMDGFELLTELKSSESTGSIPVVMLTALADMEGRLNALATGVDDYMTKPFDARELLARVRNLLQFADLRKEISSKDTVNEEVSEDDVSEASGIPQWGNTWLNKVEDQVLNKLDESDYTIGHLAHDIGIGERQFHRKIKVLTGLTPNLYIREIRLREARRILEEGEVESVAQACYRVGFDHTHYFSTIFQKRYGKAPSLYLRKRIYR